MIERAAKGEDLGEELKKASDSAHWLSDVRRDYYASRDDSDGPFEQELTTTCEAALAVEAAAALSLFGAAESAARAVALASRPPEEGEDRRPPDPAETAVQRALVRDIFGRPLRLEAVDAAWLTPTVVRLAQDIYEARAFDQMPILGDALEDAGCADEAVLGHCRGPGPHARGCWVLDLLRG